MCVWSGEGGKGGRQSSLRASSARPSRVYIRSITSGKESSIGSGRSVITVVIHRRRVLLYFPPSARKRRKYFQFERQVQDIRKFRTMMDEASIINASYVRLTIEYTVHLIEIDVTFLASDWIAVDHLLITTNCSVNILIDLVCTSSGNNAAVSFSYSSLV